MIHTKPKSKYPFTTNSSMLLGEGLRLGSGVVVSANLFPRCGQVDYARISYIGREHVNSNIGIVKVVDSNNDLVCTIEFSLTKAESETVGVAKRQGETCGVMVVTQEFIPLLKANYYPDKDALIFTPSAFYPRPMPTIYGGRLISAGGDEIHEIAYNNTQFKVTESGEASVILTTGEDRADYRVPIAEVTINGNPATLVDGNLNMLSKPQSAVLIDTDSDGILIGGYRDL